MLNDLTFNLKNKPLFYHLHPFSMQKATFYDVKDGLLQGERPPLARQKACF